jgi:hypothetical protein
MGQAKNFLIAPPKNVVGDVVVSVDAETAATVKRRDNLRSCLI